MDLLKSLVELAQKSKAVAFGLVVAALLFIGGPRYAPSVIPDLPKDWAWAPWLALAVCGGPLVLVMFASGLRLVWRAVQGLRRWLAARGKLGDDEERLLLTLGEAPDHTVHVGRLALYNPGRSALELKATADKLTSRGLINRNPFDADLCTLSGAGRARTLQLQRDIAAPQLRPPAKGD